MALKKPVLKILALAGAPECGTKLFSKDAFKETEQTNLEFMFMDLQHDYGVIGLNCITKYFNEGWSLLADAVKNPVYNEKDF